MLRQLDNRVADAGQRPYEPFALGLAELVDRICGGRVDLWEHPIDEVTRFVAEMDQGLAAVTGMRCPFDQSALLERVEQRGRAGTAHEEAFGDRVGGQRLAGLEDGEALNTLGERSAMLRRRRLISPSSASAARIRLAATSAPDRLAPGNSRSKLLGTRIGVTFSMCCSIPRTLIARHLATLGVGSLVSTATGAATDPRGC